MIVPAVPGLGVARRCLAGGSHRLISVKRRRSTGGVGSHTRQALSRMQIQRPVTTLTDPAEEGLLSRTFRAII